MYLPQTVVSVNRSEMFNVEGLGTVLDWVTIGVKRIDTSID